MLAINQIPLYECDQNDPLVKHIKAALKEIKKKKVWKLVFHKSKIRPKLPGAQTGRLETSAGISMKSTAKYVFDGMDHDITYYTNVSGTKDNKKFVPNYVGFGATLPLDPTKEADKIFFMTCVSTSCDVYEKIRAYQNTKARSDLYYTIEDVVADAISSNAIQRDAAKVNTLLFDVDFGLTDEVLIELAPAHGVANAKDLDIALVRHHMSKYLLTQKDDIYNKDRISAFLESLKDNSLARLREVIKKAIARKLIINTKTTTNKDAWYDTNWKGEKRKVVCSIKEGQNPELALLTHLSAFPKKRTAFEDYIAEGGDQKPENYVEDHTIEKVEAE